MYILANMWFQKLMIQFFFNIDKIVYGFISAIYNLLMSIARTTIFSQADIMEFADRIYNLLAVFMIFKVTFSLILYIVNPDDFSDKNKGITKLGTNIIISLCLLILTPYIFNYAYELQTMVLQENTIPKLIMGDKTDNNYLNTAGDEIAFITMNAFFSPNTSVEELYDCSTVTIKNDKGEIKFNPECSGLDSKRKSTGDSNSLMALTNEKYFPEILLKNYVVGVENSSLGLMFRQDLALATDEENEFFIMDYKYIFSTVVGVIIILLLITFCMDIAVRSIKLAFLQLIAPIPIISYVDPKSGKDGLFKKWYQMCFSTYLSLFIRLLALFFAIYIISKVASLKMIDLIDGSQQTNKLVAIFIIIGALMFAKQLPKILEGLGIKLDGGGFHLNPLRKFEKDAIGGGMLKGFNDSMAKTGQAIAKMPFRAAAGVGTAALVGGSSLLTGQGLRGMGKAFGGAMKGEKFGKNFSSSYSAARSRKRQVDEMRADGVSPWEVRKENFLNTFRGSTPAQRTKKNIERMENVTKGYDQIRTTATAIDDVAKAQSNLVKGIEAAGASAFKDGVDAKLSDGTVIRGAGKTASQIYQEVLNGENTILDNRIIGLANGSVAWSGNSAAIENAKTTVSNTVKNMQAEIDSIKEEIPGVKISDIIDKKSGKIGNVKATGKGAQGAKSALSSSTTHQATLDKYTKKPKDSK